MGCTNSKNEKDEALRLCKERRRFIKQAIDSRYALAAAHVSYTQSLRNIGIALRRYAEAEVLIESSLSISDKTPSHSSYPSPSPSHLAEVSDSPLHNEVTVSPAVPALSYMRSGGTTAVTVSFSPVNDGYAEEFPMPPPPPPLPESGSWDYFDPIDENDSFRFMGNNEVDLNFNEMNGWRQFKNEGASSKGGHGAREGTSRTEMEQKTYGVPCNSVDESNKNGDDLSNAGKVDGSLQESNGENKQLDIKRHVNGAIGSVPGKLAIEHSSSKKKASAEKNLSGEREDPSDFITHRAKDFLSSIKDIEHRFFRASESGKEVSRMLEANKIRVGYSEAKGRSSALTFLQAFQVACCQGNSAFVCHDPSQGTKVITWKRTTSSRSSSSRNALATASKEDGDDSGSDFVEEFSMIAGSHSSTLDRLYAWERKLCDEVKASESIRKDYDEKCEQLRYMFAKDYSSQAIDKIRAVVKDLHSRIRVAIHSVDSISKRIEKMRDEELHPQLVELTQGMIRMWKAMLECHHSQYITISLAYHSKSSTGTPQGDAHRQIMDQLLQELECFGLSFADWINGLTSYVEALDNWLQICLLPPRERSRRSLFSPRRSHGPPIFAVCRDWVMKIRGLSSNELTAAIRTFMSDLHHMMENQAELQKKTVEAKTEESENKDDENSSGDSSSNLSCIQASLTKVLDRLTKFSEESLKMYEDIKQTNETARTQYSNCRSTR
ncbi:protein ALTERED PHOSPHATE STARVATION RESPONSE 1 [Humulus lupulus]|uniref:protein ALTERED PHOSPHATE STARVATION RESPONSE 1 n=1 Tax=Humulus lupulus TaxID=3486 RepID=UPI002B408059|nr:protein ALTERED PHOSPHATE STARVATION RESPONSE 1 [Humulus lupulus]